MPNGKVFPNQLSEFVFTKSYAKWVEEEKRRESFPETTGRYIKYMFNGKNVPPKMVKLIKHYINNLEVLPSMRALWGAGPAVDRDNTAIYNCSFLPMDNLRAFAELLYILMQSTGVGFSVERVFVNNLPLINTPTGVVTDFIVPDSSAGWADSVFYGVTQWYLGNDVNFDFSKCRPRGARLRTKGGKSSGPEPLRDALLGARDIIRGQAGGRLRSIHVYDICCMLANIVKVGGFREAACISFSDVDDVEMRHAKDWSRGSFPEYRYLSNNSSYFSERPSEKVFWDEWNALVKSQAGERGFSIANWHKRSDRPAHKIRSNPCVTGNTMVMTDRGFIKIKDLVGEPTGLVVDKRFGTDGRGHTTSTGAFKTATKEVFCLTTKSGYRLRLTADHKIMTNRGMVEAQYITSSDDIHLSNNGSSFGRKGSREIGLVAGWTAVSGIVEGEEDPRLFFHSTERSITDDIINSIGEVTGFSPKIEEFAGTNVVIVTSPHLREFIKENHQVPWYVWEGSEICQKSFLSAIFTAVGGVYIDTATTSYKDNYIYMTSVPEHIMNEIQVMLLNFGITSVYEGGILSVFNLKRFQDRIGFLTSEKKDRLSNVVKYIDDFTEHYVDTLSSFISDGVEDVYDLTEPTTHSFVANGFVVSNCHEIGLRYEEAHDPWTGEGGGGGFCNLSAVVMRSTDTVETMAEKVRAAVWIGATQASYTHFPYLRPAWSRIAREDALLGVDITGQCDNPELSNNEEAMTYLNKVARETAKEAAEALGINYPAAITCGKPSGNSSQLVNCASGFHNRHSQYYYRHVRITGSDALFRLVRDQGIEVFKDNGHEHVPDEECVKWVVRFPVKSPEGAKFRHSETALEQCERYLRIMRTWCGEKGHNQSATIYVRPDEWTPVGQWLWDNFDKVTGLTFLPFSESDTKYRLPPYQEITSEEYEEAMKKMPNLDFSVLPYYESQDQTEGASELACFAGNCAV